MRSSLSSAVLALALGVAWVAGVGPRNLAAAPRPTTDAPPAIAAPASPACPIQVDIVQPTAGSVVQDNVLVVATVSTTCQLQAVFATAPGLIYPFPLVFVQRCLFQSSCWRATVPLSTVPSGPFTLTVTAIDFAGDADSSSVSLFHDLPPTLTLVSPAVDALVRPVVHVTAACQDDNPGGCTNLYMYVQGGLLLSVKSSIDQDVSLAAYDGKAVTLTFVGVDSAGSPVSIARRVYVESSAGLVETIRVPGTVLDDSATQTLFTDDAGQVSLYEKASDQTTVLLGGAAYLTNAGYLTPHGALFGSQLVTGGSSDIYEWRDGVLIDRDPGNGSTDLRVSGGYAIWGQIKFEDISTGTVVALSNMGQFNNDVAINGDVAYWTNPTPFQIGRYRNNVQTALTSDATTNNLFPVTDGINVAYKKAQLSDANSTKSTRLITPTGEVPLGVFSGEVTAPRLDYAVNAGWTAYTQPGLGAARNVWVRDPAGVQTQLTFYNDKVSISALNDDGRVAVNHAGRMSIVQAGASPVDVGGAWGGATSNDHHVFWRAGDLYAMVGRSVLRWNACMFAVSPTTLPFGAGGGSGTITVTTTAGCPWTAASGSPGVSFPTGAGATGSGSVSVAVAANPDHARTGLVVVAGKVVTITQEGTCAANPSAADSVCVNGTWWPANNPVVQGVPVLTGPADLTAYDPTRGLWSVLTAASGWTVGVSYGWGVPGDQPLRADFDGDGIPDLVVYRPSNGTWFLRFSSSNFSYSNVISYQWGLPGDIPVAADFDGDKKADLVVYRPTNGTWYVRFSSANYSFANWTSYQWGLPGDTPVRADFDGDGKADLVVYRPSDGTWYVRFSSSNYSFATWTAYQWGLPGDLPMAEDFDGDGRTDLVVYRPSDGTWYVRFSSSNFSYVGWSAYAWGLAADVPVLGDFDGDGKADLVVWRPSNGTWYFRYSIGGYSFSTWRAFQWGNAGNVIVQ